MELYYETPGSIAEALGMLADEKAIFIDTEDALNILTQYPERSYKLHWNSPVQGRVVMIPQQEKDQDKDGIAAGHR
jgi:hypothetical protein